MACKEKHWKREREMKCDAWQKFLHLLSHLGSAVLVSWRKLDELCQLTHIVPEKTQSRKLAPLCHITVHYNLNPTNPNRCQHANFIKVWNLSFTQRHCIVCADRSHQYLPFHMLLILDLMGKWENSHLWRSFFKSQASSVSRPMSCV